MSVLVEALCLVVPQHVLSAAFPGGGEAFAQALITLDRPPRFVVSGDAHLLSASFLDADHLEPAAALLEAHGLVDVDEEEQQVVDFAYVDQHDGPLVPCNWLEWAQHEDGFTSAWMTGAEPGEMAVPEGWSPDQSRQLTRSDVRDEAGRCLRIAVEGDLETWVDFTTGRLFTAPARDEGGALTLIMSRSGSRNGIPVTSVSGAGPMMQVVIRALEAREQRYTMLRPETVLFRVSKTNSAHDVRLMAEEDTRVLMCSVPLGPRVPAARRATVAEAVVRANYLLGAGHFDLDMSDGEVRYYASLDIEGGALVPTMVDNLIDAAVQACEQFCMPLMRVAFGDVEPAAAIAAAIADAEAEAESEG